LVSGSIKTGTIIGFAGSFNPRTKKYYTSVASAIVTSLSMSTRDFNTLEFESDGLDVGATPGTEFERVGGGGVDLDAGRFTTGVTAVCDVRARE
jgi:hypothetical protein